jgi:hypothetical protein
MPDPQTLQQMMAAPKEPDPMSVAAKAQYEKVKADSAKAVGQQSLDSEKAQVQSQLQAAQLAQKTDYDSQKLELERQKQEQTHQYEMQKLEVERQKVIAMANRPVSTP